MREHHDRVPDWLVERLAAGELSPVEASRTRARLEAHGELGRLAELAAADRAFLQQHPAERVVAEIERRGRREPAASPTAAKWWLIAPGALAVVATAIVLVLSRGAAPTREVDEPGAEVVRIKGQRPYLAIYRKRSASADRLADGARVRPGETIQVAYVAAGQRFGVIASIDALGAVTLHVPEEPGRAIELVASGETPVPHAFVLDDAPGFERFVFVTSDRPFASDVVVETLSGSGASLPAHLSHFELTLQKETP